MKKVTLAIVGAGSRGWAYASYASHHSHEVNVVAVAEPRREYREKLAVEHKMGIRRINATFDTNVVQTADCRQLPITVERYKCCLRL